METLIKLALIAITAPLWLPMAREIRDQIAIAVSSDERPDAAGGELISIPLNGARAATPNFRDTDPPAALPARGGVWSSEFERRRASNRG